MSLKYSVNISLVILICAFSLPDIAAAVSDAQPLPVRRSNINSVAISSAAKPAVKPEHITESVVKTVKVSDSLRLSQEDASIYANIFALQDIGNFKKADREIKKLSDHRLLGNVLYQRYLGKYYTSSYEELKKWMHDYGDHAGANKIYGLAAKKRPKSGGGKLEKPRTNRATIGYHFDDIGKLSNPYMSEKKHSNKEKAVMGQISRNLSSRPTAALKTLEESRDIFSDPKKYDALRAQIAESYFYNGRVDQAYALATVSANRSGKDVPLAGWIAGLSAWKYKKYGEAAKYFEMAAKSKRSSAWTVSASAHWAARAHLRNRNPQRVSYWLRVAAEYPRSFYGIISVKALGMENSRFNWGMPELNGKMVKLLSSNSAGRRALALMDARNLTLAEKELRQINPGKNKSIQEAMMALAHRIGAPAFEMRLGSGLKDKSGNLYDSALYPDAPWQPEGGYYIDKALVNAFIRQESKFNPNVSNRSTGAAGLMQLMPRTARNVAKQSNISFNSARLKMPAFNIRLGQKYLDGLLKDKKVNNNIFKLTVAYNAGPGNLAKWERRLDYSDDPLLFIESIPVNETRVFVERVLTNYWIYSLKYGQNTESLENVASGDWPVYNGQMQE